MLADFAPRMAEVMVPPVNAVAAVACVVVSGKVMVPPAETANFSVPALFLIWKNWVVATGSADGWNRMPPAAL